MKSKLIFIQSILFALLGCSGDGGGFQLFEFGPATPNNPPPATVTVNAGSDQTVTEGDTIEISGTASHSESSSLSFRWSQSNGPTVAIPRPDLRVLPFVAPPVTETTTFTFRLRATDFFGVTNADSVIITVEPTSASSLCLEAPLFTTSYAWTNHSCTTDSSDIADDSRIATLYRQSEAEPNDSLQSANLLTFAVQAASERLASDIAGSISGLDNDADDFFIFTPPFSGSYEIYLCNDPIACLRGTSTESFFLSLSNQHFEKIGGTNGGTLGKQLLLFELEAGLPYYIGVHAWETVSPAWEYNLTILSSGTAPDANTSVFQQPPNDSEVLFGGTYADNFSLIEPSTVSEIRWWGRATTDETFTVEFYQDAVVDGPAEIAFYQAIVTPLERNPTQLLTFPGDQVIEFRAKLPPVSLESNTTYYMLLIDPGSGWLSSQRFGERYFWFRSSQGNWVRAANPNGDLAFELRGQIIQ